MPVNDPFLSDGSRKRKRISKPSAIRQRNSKERDSRDRGSRDRGSKQPRQEAGAQDDEEISDVSESEDNQGDVSLDSDKAGDSDAEISSDEEFADETAADKRRRLAKQYLENLKQETEGDNYAFDAEDLDRDNISKRLKEDVAEQKGNIHRFIGDKLLVKESKSHTARFFSQSMTAVAVHYPYCFTVSKDMVLCKWDVSDFSKKPKQIKYTKGGVQFLQLNQKEPHRNGHCDEILACAASPDGKYIVTGGRDKRLIVWSTENLSPVRVLEIRDRRGEILSLTFRRNSDQLYVACADLKIRTYSINQLAQLETLYGHQDLVVGISALGQERCVTVGSRDRTAMLWKIADETRLTFRGGDYTRKSKEAGFFAEGSMDCVSMMDDTHFVTGSDNGNISLWSLSKKKPLFTLRAAHGIEPAADVSRASAEKDNAAVPEPQPYWITSIHAIPYSDTFVSGSWNGSIKVWKLESDFKSFTLVGDLEGARGVVTSLVVAEEEEEERKKRTDGQSFKVLATLSKEHRLGRWLKRDARNALYSSVIHQQNI